MDYLQNREIRLVINIPSHEGDSASHRILKDEYLIRRKAAEFGIPIVTNLELARALIRRLFDRMLDNNQKVPLTPGPARFLLRLRPPFVSPLEIQPIKRSRCMPLSLRHLRILQPTRNPSTAVELRGKLIRDCAHQSRH